MLQAVGAGRRTVLSLFLAEALLLAGVGIAIGLPTGRLLGSAAVTATAQTVETFFVAAVAESSAASLRLTLTDALAVVCIVTPRALYEVWNGDWKAWLDGDTHRLLSVGESDVEIDLSLAPAKPLTLHGERGLSQKGPQAGNASHYYSFTRLLTEGTVRIGRQTYAIHGDSWMDHEFSTSFLEPGQLGWDWFAIQLDHGVDLMLYRMRREGGATDPFSSGSWILPSGERRPLSATDFLMTPQRDWVSSETGAAYPLHWRIEIPSLQCRLTVRPAFERQEMTTSDTTGINYWEGAIEVAGEVGGAKVTGRGYLELTGYAGRGLGEVLE